MPPFRDGFHYDPDVSRICTALSVADTVVPLVLRRFEFWLILAFHLAVTMLYVFEIIPGLSEPAEWAKLNWNQVRVVTAITTFFEVFYISQCFNRYLRLYKAMRFLLTDFTLICLDVRLRIRVPYPHHAWLALRYLTASCFLVFMEVDPANALPRSEAVAAGYWTDSASDLEKEKASCVCFGRRGGKRREVSAQRSPGYTQGRSSLDPLDLLMRRGLIRADEHASLKALDPAYHPLMLLHWGGEVLHMGYDEAKAPASAKQAALTRLLKTHSAMRNLIDTICLPVPFQYFHILNVMLVANLFLWAYIMGASADFGGTPIFIICAVVFMGMMELASQLANPFASRVVNFPIECWLADHSSRAECILECKFYGGSLEKGWEAVLEKETRLGSRCDTRMPAPASPGNGASSASKLLA